MDQKIVKKKIKKIRIIYKCILHLSKNHKNNIKMEAKKKFITINGSRCWITEKKSLAEAIHSAKNICDHSEEIIVREIKDFTDYTRIYTNQ